MRGIVLAGGTGSRLMPLTKVVKSTGFWGDAGTFDGITECAAVLR